MITSAALVVIVVGLAFASADIVLVKAIGLGAAVAVFIDATNRALAAGALHHAAVGTLELVGAVLALRASDPLSAMTCRVRLVGLALVVLMLAAACGAEVTPLASAPTPSPGERTFPAIDLPADEAPHGNLSEWWYFTGRLNTGDRRTLGFEFVIFQAVRGGGPPAYAAHFAITDVAAGEMLYEERTALGPSTGPSDALDLCVDGWRLAFDGDRFTVDAAMPGYVVNLAFDPAYRAVEHHGGVLDFGELGWSYYYSYPRLSVTGRLTDAGGAVGVSGTAWFDHQWGDFISVTSGGWDWMSLRFDDGRDLMVTEIWDERRRLVLGYATLSGAGRALPSDER